MSDRDDSSAGEGDNPPAGDDRRHGGNSAGDEGRPRDQDGSGDEEETSAWTLRSRGRRVVSWLVEASTEERLLISLASLVLSLLVGALLLLGSGWLATCREPFLVLGATELCYNPVNIYAVMFDGAFGSPVSIARTLRQTTLLMLAGAAVAITFRAGIFNIGTQGQFILGGLACGAVVPAAAGLFPENAVGGIALLVIGFLAAGVVGALYGALPGVLLAYYEANEVITTIMLNIIAAGFASAITREFLREGAAVQTPSIPDYARPPNLLFPAGGRFTIVVLIPSLVLVIGTYFLLTNTSYGYDIRLSGLQPEAAEYSGVDAKAVIVRTFTLSGFIGGLSGAVFLFMVLGYFNPNGVPSIGFDGITVSVLAANNPIGVIPASLLFGAIKSGSLSLGIATEAPRELAGVLRGIIILFIAMPEAIRLLGIHSGIAGRPAGPPAEEDQDV